MPRISRLEDHYEFVMAAIAAGETFTEIALKLTAKGCPTSRTNLATWLKRRKSRIEKRTAQATPFAQMPAVAQSQVMATVAQKAPIPVEALATGKKKTKIPNLVPSSSLVDKPLSAARAGMADLLSEIADESPFGSLQKK